MRLSSRGEASDQCPGSLRSLDLFKAAGHSSKLDRRSLKKIGAFGTRGMGLVGVRGFEPPASTSRT